MQSRVGGPWETPQQKRASPGGPWTPTWESHCPPCMPVAGWNADILVFRPAWLWGVAFGTEPWACPHCSSDSGKSCRFDGPRLPPVSSMNNDAPPWGGNMGKPAALQVCLRAGQLWKTRCCGTWASGSRERGSACRAQHAWEALAGCAQRHLHVRSLRGEGPQLPQVPQGSEN